MKTPSTINKDVGRARNLVDPGQLSAAFSVTSLTAGLELLGQLWSLPMNGAQCWLQFIDMNKYTKLKQNTSRTWSEIRKSENLLSDDIVLPPWCVASESLCGGHLCAKKTPLRVLTSNG